MPSAPKYPVASPETARFLSLAALLLSAGCPPPAGAPDAGGVFPPHEKKLPFELTRPDVGVPETPEELAAVTDTYLGLLRDSRWLDAVAVRAHGWPESAGDAWYATWWSGVTMRVAGGALTYAHPPKGSDNNGFRTAPLLEGACHAARLWRDPRDERLVRRLVRGFSSWRKVMLRSASDVDTGLLARAAYPPPVADTARGIAIDTSINRPGLDGEPSEYVHVPENPLWPDVWVKNRRSKDDMGDMLRALVQLDACEGGFADPAAQQDVDEARALYRRFAQRVEADGLRIATLDKSLQEVVPDLSLNTYFLQAQAECAAETAYSLLATFVPPAATCPNLGQGPAVEGSGLPLDPMQILRTHHEAATGLAHLTANPAVGRAFTLGLARRIERLLDLEAQGGLPANAAEGDVVQLIAESAALGVPLTSREVRWMHDRVRRTAAQTFSGPEWRAGLEPVPDGAYSLEPPSGPIFFIDLGVLLGACASPYRNPAGQPLLDCARLEAAGRP